VSHIGLLYKLIYGNIACELQPVNRKPKNPFIWLRGNVLHDKKTAGATAPAFTFREIRSARTAYGNSPTTRFTIVPAAI
jgi:hypothetical protein